MPLGLKKQIFLCIFNKSAVKNGAFFFVFLEGYKKLQFISKIT